MYLKKTVFFLIVCKIITIKNINPYIKTQNSSSNFFETKFIISNLIGKISYNIYLDSCSIKTLLDSSSKSL